MYEEKKIHAVHELSGTTVSEVDAKAIPSRVGAFVPAIEPYAACLPGGVSYSRPRELGEVIGQGDTIKTVDGTVDAKNSIGMKMRSEWLLRVWTLAPHTKGTREAERIRMAGYASIGAQYE